MQQMELHHEELLVKFLEIEEFPKIATKTAACQAAFSSRTLEPHGNSSRHFKEFEKQFFVKFFS